MPTAIAALTETNTLEKRVALVPEIVKRLTDAGAIVLIEKGAGAAAAYPDRAYGEAGAILADADKVCGDADVVLRVTPPDTDRVGKLKQGCIAIGFLDPYGNPGTVKALQQQRVTSFAMELMPRTTRAQSMDALSSQRSVIGYKAVLMGAGLLNRFMPMLTTPAGTIRPASVFIIGTGVAGLQAIATAKRLGAIVMATDVRPDTGEQVESLGARFIFPDIEAASEGGYARELSEEEKKKQQELLAKHVSKADIVITTAAIPGRTSPKIITEQMVLTMKPGAVIVDAAAEGGGNCALSRPGATTEHGGVTIHAPLNIPSTLAMHASDMYSKNLYNMLVLMLSEGELKIDWEDDIINDACLTRDGEILNDGVREHIGRN